MEKTIKSYVDNFEHGWSCEKLIRNVVALLQKNHMKRTAERLTKMGTIPALLKIYNMIGAPVTPVMS